MSSLKEAKSVGAQGHGTAVVERRTRSDILMFLGRNDYWARRVCPDREYLRHELGRSNIVQTQDPEQSL